MHATPLEPKRPEYVAFLVKGVAATGQYSCTACGYGITIHTSLPACPMCGGEAWEQVPWSPFSRAVEIQS
jgi:rubredoxin